MICQGASCRASFVLGKALAPGHFSVLFCTVFILFLSLPASAQTATQVWPEVEIFLNFSKFTRLSVQGSQVLEDGQDIVSNRASIYLDTAPMLLITQILRNDNDIFRQRYVVLRLGYIFTTSFEEFKKSPH